MKVLYLHQYFSTRDGSTGTRSYEFAKALVGRGHQVTVVCNSAATSRTGLDSPWQGGRREGVVDGIRVVEFQSDYSNHLGLVARARAFLAYGWRATKVCLSEDYDLVFASSTPLTAGIPAWFAKVFRRKPFVFEVRDLWPELPRAMGVIRNPVILGALGVLEAMLYRAADRIIGLAPGMVDSIKSRTRPGKPVVLIPNGCDLDVFGSTELSGAERFPGTSPEEFVCLFAGAHGMANGLYQVLDAAQELKRRGVQGIRIVLIGDGKMKPSLKQRAVEQGLDNVVFLDPVPKKKLAALTASADLGLMILDNVPAFYFGTSPNKFFDYLSAGLPVLVNHPGWVAGLVEKHRCGIAVPPKNPAAFADALIELSKHPERRTEFGKNARALAQSDFDRNDLAERFATYLEDTLAPARRTSPVTSEGTV